MKQVLQQLLALYKRWVSPALPVACRFVPTCSEYAMQAVERHGTVRGALLATCRVLRCHPFARAGYDPVPLEIFNTTDEAAENIRLATKWLRARPRSCR